MKGTPELGILYANHGHHRAEGFTDVDYTGCPNTSRSTTRYYVFVRGNLVSWKSKKQIFVSRSSSKDEYKAMAQTTYKLVWLRNLPGTKMSSEYQQDYKKSHAYALKIYNDPNMFDALRDIYRTLESRYVHERRTIDPSFCNDLSNDSVAKFTAIGFYCLLALDEEICPRFIYEFYKTLRLERDSNNHFSI
uniref:Cysteine-rich RLK (Receptor-like protein kinase) 8, putative n=1 Tax=Tanacetum cinerariifolium TaxID=118510 RepID=A0A699KVB8_TANCI|nr:cysteine-rich RLK (receptor-like protein kinase) 8, putative [Tanacetum cinerariifolium]